MYDRGNQFKKAFYYVMKMKMPRNKALKYNGYKEDNTALNKERHLGQV